jgi:DNA-binding GntR family transcriptional regulator
VDIAGTYRPLRDLVTDALHEMILSGELAPGERLTEDKLAEQLGVSRNPVREAIRALTAMGLVQAVPRRGAYVAMPDLGDLRHLLKIRSVLEGWAAEEAAQLSPPGLVEELTALVQEGIEASKAEDHGRAAELHRRFHVATEEAAGNPYLLEVCEPLRQRTDMVFSLLLHRRGPVSWHEHEAVRDAIADGDPERARATVAGHMLSVLEELEQPTG